MKEMVFKCDKCKERVNGKAIGTNLADDRFDSTFAVGILEPTEYDTMQQLYCSIKCFTTVLAVKFGM